MGKLRWGIIGCGVIAPSHADSVVGSEYADLVAVCDIDSEKGAEFAERYGGVAFYRDYHEMLRDGGLDAVSICTPSGLHSEMTIAAAEAGVNVLCEKPMAITVPQIDAMMAAVEKTGIKLEVIFQRRTYQITQTVREAVQSGVLGQLTLADAYLKYYRSPAYYQSADWRATWALDGGGALMNQGVHGIDVLTWIMGDVESVYAKASAKVRDIEVEDTCVALVTFANGAYGVIEGTTSSNPGEPTTFYFHGEKGTIVLSDRGIEKWAVSSDKSIVARNDPDKCVGREGPSATSDPRAISHSGHRAQVDDLCMAVTQDREPMITGGSARKAVELILAIYASAREGREIHLKSWLKEVGA
ncbi:MAG: Gfo/Idh/MocA family oxidoreductase [Anaerolineae bacterium]|nr:Gfo/Idh/MocA family oxidoreductase [Anaerolineae bacterium]